MDATYKSFTEIYMRELTRILQEAYDAVEVYVHYVQKVNGLKEAVCVKYSDSPVAPAIYLDEKYSEFQSGRSIEDIARDTAEQLNNLRDDVPVIPELNEETAKASLYCVTVNAEANTALINASPHEKFLDLAIIPRFRVGEGASFIVKNEHCSLFQLTRDEVMELAWKNTHQNGFTCKSMNEVLREIMLMQGQSEEEADDYIRMNGSHYPLYVLTNEARTDGAVALASPQALREAYDKVKKEIPSVEKIYLIPSSRHEVVIVPDSRVQEIEDLRKVHEAVQVSNVLPEDKLSSRIYKFDGRKLSFAEAPVLSNTEGKTRSHSLHH